MRKHNLPNRGKKTLRERGLLKADFESIATICRADKVGKENYEMLLFVRGGRVGGLNFKTEKIHIS